MIDGTNATNQVYTLLEARILSGLLKPRQRLVERALEKELGVSRTPIREALRQLAFAGMVQADGARGVVVRDVQVAEAFNLFAVRLPLEKLAIETTVPVTRGDHRRLNGILADMDDAFERHDFPRMVILNAQFHRALAMLTENDWLVRSLEHIRRQCYLIVQHGPIAERAGLKISLADHRKMVQLLIRRDLSSLVDLTFKHILRSALFFIRRNAIFDPTAEARADALVSMAAQLQRSPAVVLPTFALVSRDGPAHGARAESNQRKRIAVTKGPASRIQPANG